MSDASNVPALPLRGPCVVTRFRGPTNYRGSRVSGIHRRDSEMTIRATVAWDHALGSEENHLAAAMAVLARWPYRPDEPFVVVARGHGGDDLNVFYWVFAAPWQLRAAADNVME
jgi:hypothetical protein